MNWGKRQESEPKAPRLVDDDDFGDFDKQEAVAGVTDPLIAPIQPAPVQLGEAQSTRNVPTLEASLRPPLTLKDFYSEGIILVVCAILGLVYYLGVKNNRTRAKTWFKVHSPILAREFAVVGFPTKLPTTKTTVISSPTPVDEDKDLRERSPFEFASYATGRANIAFVDIKLEMARRFNPINMLIEIIMAALYETSSMPHDLMEATIYTFDGHESQYVPEVPGTSELRKLEKSAYDGFVFAIVHKDRMKQLREERFDLDVTLTRDHAKLPAWLTVMTEHGEIAEMMLDSNLIKTVEQLGDDFEFLVVTDLPVAKPKVPEDIKGTKRVQLRCRLPSSTSQYEKTAPLFEAFLGIPDKLVQKAHLSPNATNKVKSLRESIVRNLAQEAKSEKLEELAAARDKAKKEKRDKELAALDAKGQKRYLEREKEKELKKSLKRQTVKS